MLLNVALNDRQGCAATTGHEISAAPEHRLAIHPFQTASELLAQQPAGYGLEVVGDYRRRRLGAHFQEQMHMIGFAVNLDQATTPVGAQADGDISQRLMHFRCQARLAVFGHKNEMVTKRESAVI